MPSRVIHAQDIKGLNPSLHRAQSLEPRVLSGRNFRWKLSGPYSGWGSKIVSFPIPNKEVTNPYYATFNFRDIACLCTPYGIYTTDRHGQWVSVLANDPIFGDDRADYDYPWTSAFVGDSYYFSHPTFGIARYHVPTCCWEKLNLCCKPKIESKYYLFQEVADDAEIIAGPLYGITQSANRLIILARDTVSWSAIDDGTVLSCGPYCGGGFQSTSVIEYGRPLGLAEVQDGFIIWTSNGMAKFSILEGDLALAAFRTSTVSRQIVPINPYAYTVLDKGVIVFLSKSGLYSTDGNYPKPFEQEISSWLTEDELFNQASLHNQHSVRLFSSTSTNELFISLIAQHDELSRPNLYTRSLVLNLRYKKWGLLNQPHYFIGPTNLKSERTRDYHLGMINQTFNLAWFNKGKQIETIHGKRDLDSYIEVGPFTLNSEDQLFLASSIDQLGVFTSGIESLMHVESKDGLIQETTFDFTALVKTLSSFDCTKDLALAEEPLIRVNSGANIHNYTCAGQGVYHTILISTDGVSGSYDLKRLSVKLSATIEL